LQINEGERVDIALEAGRKFRSQRSGYPPTSVYVCHVTIRGIIERTSQELTVSLNAFPAENLTVLAAGIFICAPVAGLRPVRSARAPDENVPNPSN
jgi:hypothetical protein